MNQNRRIIKSIHKASRFIESQVQPDGGFISFSSADTAFSKTNEYKTTFANSLIAYCLHQGKKKYVEKKLTRGLFKLLREQKSDTYSYNYWNNKSPEYKIFSYPDDLDDTFCALIAIQTMRPRSITKAVLTFCVNLLTQTEVKPGGPYTTWLVKNNLAQWHDVDLAVNNNIAYFLSLQNTELPFLTDYIENCVKKSKYTSPYYPTWHPVIYFTARWYKGPLQKNIIEFINSNKNAAGNWGNCLHTSLCVSALLQLDEKPQNISSAISMLLDRQKQNHWEAHPFCYDPEIAGTRYYAGSPALTTAFCIEALGRYISF